MNLFEERLRWRLAGIMDIGDAVARRLESHYDLLARWNQRLNLTAIRTFEEAVDRHYAESLFLGAALRGNPQSIVDIGSGAGFPGTPIAIANPCFAVTLVESHSRKAVFLRESTRELANVRVSNVRIEANVDPFDCAVMRAVAWRDMRLTFPRVAASLAFLLSAGDAKDAAFNLREYEFESEIPIPWDSGRVALLGRRRQGRCST